MKVIAGFFMFNYSKDFLEKTIEVWQFYSFKPFSSDDVREVKEVKNLKRRRT